MIDAGVAKDQWPYAVRHASRQRFSHMAKPEVPFGAQVYVRQRSWRLGKGGERNPRVIIRPRFWLLPGNCRKATLRALLKVNCLLLLACMST